jgi:hypothetical protein
MENAPFESGPEPLDSAANGSFANGSAANGSAANGSFANGSAANGSAKAAPGVTAPKITVSTPAGELFDIQSRPGTDPCTVSAENEFNQNIYGRSVYNSFGSSRDSLIGFASDSRNLRFGDGVGETPPDQVDQSSQLRHGYGWHSRGKVQLTPRVYQGPADLSGANLEMMPEEPGVVWGESTFNRHSALSGITIDRFEPLVPELKKDIQDPEHIVPTAWVRGGQDTRAETRTLSFVGAQGFAQSGSPGGTAWVLPAPPK